MKAKSNKSGICPICNSEYITYDRPECADIETILGHNIIDKQGNSVEIEEVE